jgi:hypothetical protein
MPTRQERELAAAAYGLGLTKRANEVLEPIQQGVTGDALRDQAIGRITCIAEQHQAGLKVAERFPELLQQPQRGPRSFLVPRWPVARRSRWRREWQGKPALLPVNRAPCGRGHRKAASGDRSSAAGCVGLSADPLTPLANWPRFSNRPEDSANPPQWLPINPRDRCGCRARKIGQI